jgi:hypothetical protein
LFINYLHCKIARLACLAQFLYDIIKLFVISLPKRVKHHNMSLSKSIATLAFTLALAIGANAQEQQADSTGLPGDNFSLQGALALFKKAGKPEEFEKLINSKDNKVNNLDLNQDGKIDYIRVTNKKENDVQIFVLSALVSAKESQDIAVISLQKTAESNAMIQIEGDAEIYGEPTFAEPAPETENAFNYNDFSGSMASNEPHGPAAGSPDAIFVNVWFWPCVQFVYQPAYVVYSSPYTYVAPPVWYHPWQPMPYYEYHPYCVQYYQPHYIYVPTRRIPPARVIYRPVRTQSVTVIERNRVIVNNYRSTRVSSPRNYYGNGRNSYGNPGYNNTRGGYNYDNNSRTSGQRYNPNAGYSGRPYSPSNGGRGTYTTPSNGGRGTYTSPSNGSNTGGGRGTYQAPSTGNTSNGGGRGTYQNPSSGGNGGGGRTYSPSAGSSRPSGPASSGTRSSSPNSGSSNSGGGRSAGGRGRN